MHYSISGLCPNADQILGGYGFLIKLYPGWRLLVEESDQTQERVDLAIEKLGRMWLDACGYDRIFDGKPLYEPRQSIRIDWGDWGPEHITVPGNACGLDIGSGLHAPRGGRVLVPHNVDGWPQVQLLLIVFCWFADDLSLSAEVLKDPS